MGDTVEPLWWGRGAHNCFALIRNANGPYHRIFISTGRKGGEQYNKDGLHMELMDFELRDLGQFLIDVADGKEFNNG